MRKGDRRTVTFSMLFLTDLMTNKNHTKVIFRFGTKQNIGGVGTELVTFMAL